MPALKALGSEWVSLTRAARITDVPLSKVKRMCDDNILSPLTVGGCRYIHRSDLERLSSFLKPPGFSSLIRKLKRGD